MRWVALLLVLVLGAAAYVLPQPEPPSTGAEVGSTAPPIAVCTADEGSGRTTDIAILSTVSGPAGVTLFRSGGSAGSLKSSTGDSGSLVIPVVDVAAVGTVGGLVEMPVPSSAAGSVVRGAASLAAEACASVPPAEAFLTGGTTVEGATFEVQLMNPYAGQAVVELSVQSEAGNESNSRFESVIVPPRSSAFIDFNDLTPGRESLAVLIETLSGRVNAVARQGMNGDTAIWRAVPGATDWFLPVPKGPGSKEVVLATPANAEIDYQVDLFTVDGAEEAFASGRLDARGVSRIDVAEVSAEAIGVRIISTGPVVPTLMWMSPETGIAATTGVGALANRWFLPGATAPDGGWASIVLFNGTIEDAEVRVRPLRESTSVRTVSVDSEAVLALGLEAADGYLIESTTPIAVLWTAQSGAATSTAIGVPIVDG